MNLTIQKVKERLHTSLVCVERKMNVSVCSFNLFYVYKLMLNSKISVIDH